MRRVPTCNINMQRYRRRKQRHRNAFCTSFRVCSLCSGICCWQNKPSVYNSAVACCACLFSNTVFTTFSTQLSAATSPSSNCCLVNLSVTHCRGLHTEVQTAPSNLKTHAYGKISPYPYKLTHALRANPLHHLCRGM